MYDHFKKKSFFFFENNDVIKRSRHINASNGIKWKKEKLLFCPVTTPIRGCGGVL